MVNLEHEFDLHNYKIKQEKKILKRKIYHTVIHLQRRATSRTVLSCNFFAIFA
ncbi:hypothetical protein HanXRQr2_Chr08g0347621 [Helianthus annuus]|uniref:Uncharacterized protein n=1 Tax=Helianthus annuus TaxID=4232 RepID=A0A9K3NDT9_HELAN|nr:hypothetical protein HanXRQr2_Chr08g0347621 [Helianthus annuus]KAJ0902342.1 hypothetical protein HanPSC8_Chr08g0335851 [Helianthus annuus]